MITRIRRIRGSHNLRAPWRILYPIYNQLEDRSLPWIKTWCYIERRCRVVDYCIKKKIKNLISPLELQYLWFRDRAFLMKRPSIDRENKFGNYELSNCRYIEFVENVRLGALGNTNTKGKKTQTVESKKLISLTSKKYWNNKQWRKKFIKLRTGLKYKKGKQNGKSKHGQRKTQGREVEGR